MRRSRRIDICQSRAGMWRQQLRQLRYVSRNPPRLIAGEWRGRCARIIEIDVAKLLAVGVLHNEVAVRLLDGPRRREAACGHDTK